MKAYRFRLEAVAHLRRGQALLAHQEMARIQRELEQAKANEIASARLYEAFVSSEHPVDANAFLARFEQGERLTASVLDAALARSGRERKLAAAREAALRAERAVALLDKLDQRRRSEWVQQALREDTAVLDEFATTRAAITTGVTR